MPDYPDMSEIQTRIVWSLGASWGESWINLLPSHYLPLGCPSTVRRRVGFFQWRTLSLSGHSGQRGASGPGNGRKGRGGFPNYISYRPESPSWWLVSPVALGDSPWLVIKSTVSIASSSRLLTATEEQRISHVAWTPRGMRWWDRSPVGISPQIDKSQVKVLMKIPDSCILRHEKKE